MDSRYVLAEGTQVRQESFGLLFYTMVGPRLYFLPSENVLTGTFFHGNQTLSEWCFSKRTIVSEKGLQALSKALQQLKAKEVINER